MYRRIRASKMREGKQDATAVVLFQDDRKLPEALAGLDEQTGGALSAAIVRPEFDAKSGSLLCLYPDTGPARLFVAGLGDREAFRSDRLREAAGVITRAAEAAKVKRLAVDILPALGEAMDETEAGRAFGEGAAIGNLAFDAHKGSATGDDGKMPVSLTLESDGPLAKGITRGLKLGESVNIARRLAATPPNVAHPRYIVNYCRKMAEKVGLACNVIDTKQAKKLGMGGLLAVGAAGSQPPAMVCLTYRPGGKGGGKSGGGKSGAKPVKDPIMLVGKAVTFDTGGYSLKTRDGMVGMKYDKCGGMAVIGAMHAAATLKIRQPVVGVIAVAENMVDEKAMRVDDILTMCNGVTVEVTNTDAEGRLILADALAYGCRTYKPKAVVDMATLTGGVIVALGEHCAGFFSVDDGLRDRMLEAGQTSGERLWQLPLWPEHRKLMSSEHADLVNSGGRKAHPIQGAAFLSHFVGKGAERQMPTLPWAHVDMAGMDAAEKATGLYAVGPTGFGVRLLTRLLEQWS